MGFWICELFLSRAIAAACCHRPPPAARRHIQFLGGWSMYLCNTNIQIYICTIFVFYIILVNIIYVCKMSMRALIHKHSHRWWSRHDTATIRTLINRTESSIFRNWIQFEHQQPNDNNINNITHCGKVKKDVRDHALTHTHIHTFSIPSFVLSIFCLEIRS